MNQKEYPASKNAIQVLMRIFITGPENSKYWVMRDICLKRVLYIILNRSETLLTEVPLPIYSEVDFLNRFNTFSPTA
jgi:hypothetical protein